VAACLSCESILVRDSAFITGCTDKKSSCCLAVATNAASRATSAARKNCGDNLRNMRLKNYKADLLKRLEDPHYAAEYLAQVLAEKDSAAFLIALKDVVEAGGGVGSLAGQVGLKRPSLYKILSKNGNPTLETLQEILEPLGLRVSVALDKAA
jgi:probable addiction module antidote protein